HLVADDSIATDRTGACDWRSSRDGQRVPPPAALHPARQLAPGAGSESSESRPNGGPRPSFPASFFLAASRRVLSSALPERSAMYWSTAAFSVMTSPSSVRSAGT